MPNRFDIFISYKREERGLADAYSSALQQAGYAVVTDLNIQKAVDFGEAIDRMIRESALVLVLWTPASVKSDWVRKEAAEAERQNKYFGVTVESLLPEQLPLAVRTNQFVDVSTLTGTRAIARVISEIQTKIGPARANAAEAGAASEQISGDLEFYQMVDKIGELSGYKRYCKTYPDGIYTDEARKKIRALNHWFHRPKRWLPNAAWIGALATLIGALVTLLTVLADFGFFSAQDKAQFTQLKTDFEQVNAKYREQTTELEQANKDLKDQADRIVQANQKFNRQAARIVALENRIVSLSQLNLQARLDRYRCKINGKDGLRIDEKCISVDDTTLDLSGTQISDLTPLAGLSNLTRLYLNQTQVSDLTPLTGLGKLERLHLEQTQVGDLTPLAGLTGLEALDLEQTQAGDLTPLAGLSNLTSLSLNQTQAGDLTPLAGLSNLKWLYLNQTQISDLTPLAGLSNLKWLYLNQTRVSDLSPLKGLEDLSYFTAPNGASAGKRFSPSADDRRAVQALIGFY